MFYLVRPTTHCFVGVVTLNWQSDTQTEVHVLSFTTHHPLICCSCDDARLTVWHSKSSPCSIVYTRTPNYCVGVVSLDYTSDSQSKVHVQHCTSQHSLFCRGCVTRLTVRLSNRGPCSILYIPPLLVLWGFWC